MEKLVTVVTQTGSIINLGILLPLEKDKTNYIISGFHTNGYIILGKYPIEKALEVYEELKKEILADEITRSKKTKSTGITKHYKHTKYYEMPQYEEKR